MKRKEMKTLAWLISRWGLFDRVASPYKRAVCRQRITPEHMKIDIDNSSLLQREKEELFEGIEKYYYYDKPLSLRNRMILWKVKDCHYVKSSSIAKLALPSLKRKK